MRILGGFRPSIVVSRCAPALPWVKIIPFTFDYTGLPHQGNPLVGGIALGILIENPCDMCTHASESAPRAITSQEEPSPGLHHPGRDVPLEQQAARWTAQPAACTTCTRPRRTESATKKAPTGSTHSRAIKICVRFVNRAAPER